MRHPRVAADPADLRLSVGTDYITPIDRRTHDLFAEIGERDGEGPADLRADDVPRRAPRVEPEVMLQHACARVRLHALARGIERPAARRI